MGQYYGCYLQDASTLREEAFLIVGGAKLTEHSWFENDSVNYIANRLYERSCITAWVGDYARDCDPPCPDLIYEQVHDETGHPVELRHDHNTGHMLVNECDAGEIYPFNMHDRFVVNHTKREYVDCEAFYRSMLGKSSLGEEWVMHPLPLLTAIGNGQGGGDYYGVNNDKIGCWALDIISIEETAPSDYERKDFEFYEK